MSETFNLRECEQGHRRMTDCVVNTPWMDFSENIKEAVALLETHRFQVFYDPLINYAGLINFQIDEIERLNSVVSSYKSHIEELKTKLVNKKKNKNKHIKTILTYPIYTELVIYRI